MSSLEQSPNIIKLLGYTEEPYSIVMKLYQEGSLHDFIFKKHNKVTPQLAASMALDIASGMRDMHAIGVVHFDLKPANVLLEKSGDGMRCLICDFGFATIIGQRPRNLVKGLNRPKNAGMTVAYSPPEVSYSALCAF